RGGRAVAQEHGRGGKAAARRAGPRGPLTGAASWRVQAAWVALPAIMAQPYPSAPQSGRTNGSVGDGGFVRLCGFGGQIVTAAAAPLPVAAWAPGVAVGSDGNFLAPTNFAAGATP